MFVFSVSNFDQKYMSREIRSCFQDSVDMNVKSVHVISVVEGAPGRADIPCFKYWAEPMDPAPATPKSWRRPCLHSASILTFYFTAGWTNTSKITYLTIDSLPLFRVNTTIIIFRFTLFRTNCLDDDCHWFSFEWALPRLQSANWLAILLKNLANRVTVIGVSQRLKIGLLFNDVCVNCYQFGNLIGISTD